MPSSLFAAADHDCKRYRNELFSRRPLSSRKRPYSGRLGLAALCQKQTKKAATFDAVWRFSEHHTDPYVSGSDMKNVVRDCWPHHDEISKERAYCGVVV
jgi:hypothetical protein